MWHFPVVIAAHLVTIACALLWLAVLKRSERRCRTRVILARFAIAAIAVAGLRCFSLVNLWQLYGAPGDVEHLAEASSRTLTLLNLSSVAWCVVFCYLPLASIRQLLDRRP